MAPPPASTEPLPLPVDPLVWKACAGDAACFPAVGSFVFYFPEGHAEQASSPVDLSSFAPPLFYRCLVTAVDLLADPVSDEVLSRTHLAPVPFGAAPSPELLRRCRFDSALDVSEAGDGFLSNTKVLTQSDAHNGGGFSVPKFCADTLFPSLDYEAKPPAQKLSMRDVQGKVWEFRHIYRGKPPRHLLTTGWSDFVNAKSLVAGDSVVFMRSAREEFFIGVRRKSRGTISNYSKYASGKSEESLSGHNVFSRNERGRIPPSSVVGAVEAAKLDKPFEVLYYPRGISPEFIVSEGLVNVAMGIQWNVGARIRISTQDRVNGLQGTVEAIKPCFFSPWRMLQVIWDEEGVLKDVKSVNPWQVELVSASPHEEIPFPVMKKLKVQQGQFLGDKESNFLSEMSRSGVDDISPNYWSVPVGMQGARHDSYFVSSLHNLPPTNTSLMTSDDLDIIKTPQNNDVCTVLNNRNNLQSRDSSLCSQESIRDMNIEVYKPIPRHPIKEASEIYFKLFGHIIQIKQPIDKDANEKQGSKDGQISQINQHVEYDAKEKRGSKDGEINQIKQHVDNAQDGYGVSENGPINQITLSGNFDSVVRLP